jgi:hypothetical protein
VVIAGLTSTITAHSRGDGLARGDPIFTGRRVGRDAERPFAEKIPNSGAARRAGVFQLRSDPRGNTGPARVPICFCRSFAPSGSRPWAPKLRRRAPSCTTSHTPHDRASITSYRLSERYSRAAGSRLAKNHHRLRPTLPPERARQLPRRVQNVFLLTGRCCLEDQFSGTIPVSPALAPILHYHNELRGFSERFQSLQQPTPDLNRPSQLLTEIRFPSFRHPQIMRRRSSPRKPKFHTFGLKPAAARAGTNPKERRRAQQTK